MSKTAFCYQVGDYRILLETGLRSEVLSALAVYPVPYAPDWCAGLTAVRGTLCPVLDMHRILLRQTIPQHHYLLWLQAEGQAPVVVGCDALPRQVSWPEEQDQSERLPGLPGWVQAVWAQPSGLLLAADHLRLFKLLVNSRAIA